MNTRRELKIGLLTEREHSRIEQIRANLNEQRIKGAPVEDWEAHFFLGVIDKLLGWDNHARN